MPETAVQKPILQFSVPCLGVDERDGPPCFMYVFYELPLNHFPYKFPETAGFFIVNGWSQGRGRFRQQVRIRGADGQVLLDPPPREFVLADPRYPYMMVNFIQGFEFPRPGDYSVEILLEGEPVMSYSLGITRAPAEEPAVEV
ncbi:MAG: hypothetical protein HY319_00425 [Armatimonadetes bacterium]|nr:hypothetical protein [Armatimonadota bacterium]